jgi:hypothetical protein
MAFIRYTASADTTIVNAYQPDLQTRGTGANAGMADVGEVFSIYGRVSSGSQELSRMLLKFPISQLSADRSDNILPASGKVSYYLRMFNTPTSKTTPRDYSLVVAAVTKDWQEGVGLDLEGYKDLTEGNTGANWMSASNAQAWANYGGDYLSTADHIYSQSFSSGLGDMELDITPLVEKWIAGTQDNYGVLIKLSASYEASASMEYVNLDEAVVYNPKGATKSYYTKRFFARGSQYFFKRPLLEARWDDTTRDDRSNFYFSSSRAPAADNLNTIYFYNMIRGRLVDLPGISSGDKILVSLYSGSLQNSGPSGSKLALYDDSKTNLTGGWVSTGVYSCSVGIVSSAVSPLYDVWHWGAGGTGGTEYYTGSIKPKTFDTGNTSGHPRYVINITNLQNSYSAKETARLNLFIRDKNWSPTIYTVAKSTIQSLPILSASYKVYRLMDGYQAVAYGTGSDFHTGLSYDVNGNYFDFDMASLEPNYAYAFKFVFYDEQTKSWQEQAESFKFRVEKSEP